MKEKKKVGLCVRGKTDTSKGKGRKRGINHADHSNYTKFPREGKEGVLFANFLLANISFPP